MKKKLCAWGYGLGILSGYSTTFAGGESSVTSVRFSGRRRPDGKRNAPVYVLGVPVASWRCFLRYRHVPSPHKVGLGMCAKCCPCPDCGKAAPLDHDCEVAA